MLKTLYNHIFNYNNQSYQLIYQSTSNTFNNLLESLKQSNITQSITSITIESIKAIISYYMTPAPHIYNTTPVLPLKQSYQSIYTQSHQSLTTISFQHI